MLALPQRPVHGGSAALGPDLGLERFPNSTQVTHVEHLCLGGRPPRRGQVGTVAPPAVALARPAHSSSVATGCHPKFGQLNKKKKVEPSTKTVETSSGTA